MHPDIKKLIYGKSDFNRYKSKLIEIKSSLNIIVLFLILIQDINEMVLNEIYSITKKFFFWAREKKPEFEC